MKIDRLSTTGTPATKRSARSGSTKSGAFAESLSAGGETPLASAVSGTAAMAPIDALLALQEVSEDPGGRNRGRRHGEELLDRLDDIRLGLLSGRMSIGALERLSAMVVAQRAQVDDPNLAIILNEIEIRAAVELAKLGR